MDGREEEGPELPHDIGRELVEGAKPGAIRALPEGLPHPLPHLGCRLVGGRQRQHSRALVLFQQPGHPQHEHDGLPGTPAGKNQDRAAVPRSRGAVVLVEALEGDHRGRRRK